MERTKLALTEQGEGVIDGSKLLQMIAEAIVYGAQAMDSGGPTWSYLAGTINSLCVAGLITEVPRTPGQAGSLPEDPPSFFLEAYRDKKSKGEEDGEAKGGKQ